MKFHQKYDKKEKEENVTAKENCTESKLEKKCVAQDSEKKEIIRLTKHKQKNWEGSQKCSNLRKVVIFKYFRPLQFVSSGFSAG